MICDISSERDLLFKCFDQKRITCLFQSLAVKDEHINVARVQKAFLFRANATPYNTKLYPVKIVILA